jgi:hypothetical protein
MDLLQGKKVPNKIYTFPNIVINQKALPDWLKVTPNGNVAAWLWTRNQTQQVLQANQQGNTSNLPTPAVPSQAP